MAIWVICMSPRCGAHRTVASIGSNLSVAQQVARIKRKIRAIAPAIKPAVQKVIEADAAALVKMQKRFAPVDEGDLRDDIHATPLKAGRIGVIVHSDDWKSRWIEFGTEKMRAHPFFFPPWRSMKRAIKSNIGKATRAAGKRAVK